MKVVILAAGKGTRLLPLTEQTPKPLLGVGGKLIIDRLFESLPEEITEAIIVVEHLKSKIMTHIGEVFYDRPVRYVDQVAMRGTLGAVLSAKPLLAKGERFLVINGDDIHHQSELKECLRYDRAFGLQKTVMPGYHSIHLYGQGFIEGFYPQTNSEVRHGALTATGAYVVDTDIFDQSEVVLHDGKEYGLPQTMLAQKATPN